MDMQCTHACHAWFTHTTGNDRRVACHTAASCQDTHCCVHSADIFGTGFDANKNDLFALVSPELGSISAEYNLADRGARRCRQPLGDNISPGLWVKVRMQQTFQLFRCYPSYCFLFGNKFLIGHIDRILNRRFSRPFAGARLENIKFLVLNRKFHILHIFVVLLQFGHKTGKLLIGLRQAPS